MIYSILTISILVGIIVLAVLIYLLRGKQHPIFPKFIPIALITVCVSALVFLTLYKFNDYNLTYLSKYTNYTDIEPISYSGEFYNFYLIYENGEKIHATLSIKAAKPYKRVNYASFYLTDYLGETIWATFRIRNQKRINYFYNTFILNHNDKWEKFKNKNKKP